MAKYMAKKNPVRIFATIKNLIIATLFAILTFSAALTLFNSTGVSARAFDPSGLTGNDPYNLLPLKSEEYFALRYPNHAYSDDEITAITTAADELIIFNGGTYVKTVTSTTPLKQVTRLGDYLLYSNNQTVTAIKTDGEKDAKSVKLTYIDSQGEVKDMNCVFFSVTEKNGEYLLATITNRNLLIFKITDGLNASLYYDGQNRITADDAPVAINSNSVFYVSGGKIMRRYLSEIGTEIEQLSVTPSDMIANDEFVYYIDGGNICRFGISESTPSAETLATENTPFELGKPRNPSGITFKGDDLFITDNLAEGSVQQFAVKENRLFFTGFAVANDLTAYNRVGKDPSDISLSGDFVAVKDDYKITVISLAESGYARERFKNICVGNPPSYFALGNGTLVYADDDKINAIILETGEQTVIEENYGNIRAISYNSGYYFIACPDGTKTVFTKIAENDIFANDGATIFAKTYNSVPTLNLIATDVFGNVYIADNNEIWKNGTSLSLSHVDKIATDLAGNLFALANGKITRYDSDAGEFTDAFTDERGEIVAFDVDVINDALCYSVRNADGLLITLSAGNTALYQAKPTEEFNSFTEKINELKIYSVRDGANLYSVSAADSEFIYKGLTPVNAENSYLLISEIELPYGTVLYALASKTGLILADKRELTEKTVSYYPADETPAKTFVSTKVCAYALPITVKGDGFAMTSGGEKTVLDKGTELAVSEKFALLGADFYRATAKIGDGTLECYVPASFTANKLSENFELDTFTVETLIKTTLYEDEELSTAITEIEDGTAVKVYEKKNGYLKISVSTENGDLFGYVDANAIKNNPNVATRNVLIVLALIASICGTVSFIISRKRK